MTPEKQAQKFHTDVASLPDLGSASDWTCRVGNLIQPIRSTTKIWVVMHHQYGISAFVFDFSDIIWQGNQWWGCQMLAVFSGY